MTLREMVDEIAAALTPLAAEIPDLQVYPYWNPDPSAPAIDVFPGNPFQTGAGFRAGDHQVFFTVRARVAMSDPEAGQQLLLRLADGPDEPASIAVALETADWAVVDDVPGYTQYADDVSANERLLGLEWRVSKFQ